MIEESKKNRHRSPAYPSVDLEEALSKCSILHAQGLDTFTPELALQHWQYQPGSANGMRAVAALKLYGLVEEIRDGGGRELKLTDLACSLLSPSREDEKLESMRRAAMSPEIFREIWTRHLDWMPLDGGSLEHRLPGYLIRERKFNPSSVDSLIRVYLSTIAKAKLRPNDVFLGEDELTVVSDLSVPGSYSYSFGDVPGQLKSCKSSISRPWEAMYPSNSRPVDGWSWRKSLHAASSTSAFTCGSQKYFVRPESHSESKSGPQVERMRELPITLPSLKVAVVRVPEKMSELDFKALMTVMESWKEAIVESTDVEWQKAGDGLASSGELPFH